MQAFLFTVCSHKTLLCVAVRYFQSNLNMVDALTYLLTLNIFLPFDSAPLFMDQSRIFFPITFNVPRQMQMFEHILGMLGTQFEYQILYLIKKRHFFSMGDTILLNYIENEAGTQYW